MTRLGLPALLVPRAGLDRPDAAEAWFHDIAMRLLGSCRLVAGGSTMRPVEIEFYFDNAEHRDPFTHRQPDQATSGRWYFHRNGGSYRGGSFKGLDLSFGGATAHGGILIRSLETSAGDLVVGPSLCVDHLLAATGMASVAALARAIGERSAFDPEAPLSLHESNSPSTPTLYRSARVGLSLRRHPGPLGVDRLARQYRFLTEPRRITKGRRELITALLAAGHSPDEIRTLTGSPMKAILACATVRP